MSDLHTCPDRHTPNFTERGLTAHRSTDACKRRAAELIPLPFDGVSALSKTIAPLEMPEEEESWLIGQQLEAQWQQVIAGTKAQLVFGAMMLKLRARCDGARATAKLGNEARKGTGLKGWLEKYAPTVSQRTAGRLMQIAEGLQKEFHLGKSVDLEALLAASVDSLDEKLAEKRAMIEDAITGKSQRQLLLEFGRVDPTPAGGNRHPKCTGCGGDLASKTQTHCPHCGAATGQQAKSPEEVRMELVETTRQWALSQHQCDHSARKLWKLLPDHEAEALATILAERAQEIRAWTRTPSRQRDAMALEEVLA